MGAEIEIAKHLGENLRGYREQADFSQEEQSFRAGLHRTAVGQLERGERVPRADSLVKLASALEIPPGALLEGIVWRSQVTTAGTFELLPRREASQRS